MIIAVNPKLKRITRTLGKLTLWTLALLMIVWGGLEITVRLFPYDRAALNPGFPESLRIRDRHGQLLREAVNADGHRARWTPLNEISPLAIQATIAVEDHRFYAHDGVDPSAVIRAIKQNVSEGRIVSGASTLTMQLARLVKPHPRSFWNKMVEAFHARRIEQTLGKDEILEQYLNRAPYGSGAIGIEAASLRYFGKPSMHLSLAEAALVAGLPQGPGYLNPLRHPERAKNRQLTVLRRMLEEGLVSQQSHDRALNTPLRYVQAPTQPMALHFTDAVIEQHRALMRDGGDFDTTLDLALQRDVEAMVRDHVAHLKDRGLTNAAVVVLDNDQCEVLAMVGSADYWGSDDGAVNGAMALRQPGSTLKPFTYALAFEQGYSPASIVPDVETWYEDPTGQRYSPQNYHKTYLGPVMMGEALARSLNVTAIRTAQLVGAERLLDRLKAAGFDSLNESIDHYGLGITLGNGEVTLLELARAYAMFPRGGHACTPRMLKHAAGGEATQQVFDPVVSALITDVLADERLRALAFGTNNALMLGFPVAVKTGTTENWRDSWAVGFTGQYTVAVWGGDFENRPMHSLAGMAGAGPLFHRVMKRVAGSTGERGLPLGRFAGPGSRKQNGDDPQQRVADTLREVVICPTSGKAPTAHCPGTRLVRTQVRPGTPSAEVLEADDWMQPVALDARNGLRAGPHCPKRFVKHTAFAHLPAEYAEWQVTSQDLPPAPVQYSPLCPAEGPIPDALVITHPAPGDVFVVDPGMAGEAQRIALKGMVDPPSPSVEWRLDGRKVAKSEWPYTAEWALARGEHTLELVGSGGKSDPVVFEVR
ncbi:MAG: penicillin-binding protein 1C [Bradymonadia bacterium]